MFLHKLCLRTIVYSITIDYARSATRHALGSISLIKQLGSGSTGGPCCQVRVASGGQREDL
jgi:hypothetical protein